MNKLKIILLTLAIMVFFSQAFSQKDECGTKSKKSQEKASINKKKTLDDGRQFIVPVFFHVLYHNAEENIPKEKIEEVLETLQKDFQATNPDIWYVPSEFTKNIGNPRIKFVFADKYPDRDAENGIIRKYTKTKEFKLDKRRMFEQSPIIDPSKYLNVYICNVNTNGFTPWEENKPSVDGVVIGYWRAGKGIRTLTHEVGHWLNLYHIFEGGCKNNDDVEDTPGQKKHMHSCPTSPLVECNNKASMFMNFMDYSCSRYFFTDGQVERMREYVFTNRSNLSWER